MIDSFVFLFRLNRIYLVLKNWVDSNMFLWYKRNFSIRLFDLSNYLEEYHMLLHLDKVDCKTIVHMNYHFNCVRHLGGYDPFSYDVMSDVNIDKDNEIIVHV